MSFPSYCFTGKEKKHEDMSILMVDSIQNNEHVSLQLKKYGITKEDMEIVKELICGKEVSDTSSFTLLS